VYAVRWLRVVRIERSGKAYGMRKTSLRLVTWLAGVAMGLSLPLAACSFCPLEASECPSGCGAITGRPYDEVRDCVDRGVTVGCTSGGGASLEVVCSKREEDGAIFLSSTGSARQLIAGSDNWSECTPEESRPAWDAPSCWADGDAF
jgi:hypothetical protein